ncbi:MAG TPA: hypothetical protein VGK73_30325 [Polyangiaceae bacterium]
MPDRPPPKRPDPRREGNPEPTPPRSSLSTIVTGQVQAGRRNVPPPVPVHPARRGSTMTGLPAPPAAESAPQPPKLTLRDLGPLEPVDEPPDPSSLPPVGPKKSLSPPPQSYPTTAAERELAAARAEMQDARELLARLSAAAEEASSRPAPAPPELPWWRSTAGICKVIAAASGGLIAATGSIVLIINAARAPTDPQLRADVDAIKVEVRGLRAYLQQKDQARAEELEKRFDAIGARLVDLDLRYPAPKKHPDTPPN